MNNWVRQIEENIERKKLFRRGESILVAVSGGLDSMVLLDLLHRISKLHGWKIAVAHLNHQLRGRSSDADENLVRRTAASLKVRFVFERVDVKKFAKMNRLSIEMAARKLRHEFFAKTAKKLKIKTVAVAHHADDQVELFFLRLLRGAGTEGLSGMNWKSKSPADSSIHLVRPLLDQSKENLMAFANEQKIPFREDASNSSMDFQRNRIRHEILPLLKRIQPASDETILRTMEIVAVESNFVLGAALEWLSDNKKKSFSQLHPAVQRVCVRLQLRVLGFSAPFELVEKLRLQPDRVVNVDSKNSVYRDSTGMVYPRKKQSFSFGEAEVKVDLKKTTNIQFRERMFSWSFENHVGDSIQRKKNCEWFDARKVGTKVRLRHWKQGDRFQPIGAKSVAKLQDLFTNQKIPRAERHRLIVATTEQGELFWVEGLRISERFKLDKASTRRLKWRWQPLESD